MAFAMREDQLRRYAVARGGRIVGREWRSGWSPRSIACALIGHRWGTWDSEQRRVCLRGCGICEHRYTASSLPAHFGSEGWS